MKKLIVALAVVALAGAASADIKASFIAGFGIYGNGSNGGLVDNIAGTEITLQLFAGGGDGLNLDAGGVLIGVAQGNDTLIGTITDSISGTGDFGDYAATLAGVINGLDAADTWYTVSGVNAGDWVFVSPVALASLGALDAPETVFFDNGGAGVFDLDGSVVVVPEPATLGLMGIAGLGMFLARRKTRR